MSHRCLGSTLSQPHTPWARNDSLPNCLFFFLLLCCCLCLRCASEHDGAFIGYSEKSLGKTVRNRACFDADSNCDDWAAKGECQINPGFMLSKCRLACGDCSAEIPVGKYTGQNVVMRTDLGEIRIRLLWEEAPETCALVAELASRESCGSCNLYRNEDVPKVGDGPPYALLQGSLGSLLRRPPREMATLIQRRHVATITDTKDFYIALAGHESWSEAHTAWGEVFSEDMRVVDAVVQRPYKNFTHPTGTTMRMMLHPVTFSLDLLPADT